MKETRAISFNLGSKRLRQAETILERADVREAADLHLDGALRGSCTVTLSNDDPRVPVLVDLIREQGEEPSQRVDRRYSEGELASAEWLHLRLATAGLLGGVNAHQPYDRSAACPVCGVGSRPIAPLIADLGRMGKKGLDRTAHDGWLVAQRVVADALVAGDINGVELQGVRRPSSAETDEGFSWLDLSFEWPRAAETSVIRTESVCPKCQRAGHFEDPVRPIELHFSSAPVDAPDFGHTYEAFGVWDAMPVEERVGASRELIVSQRARQLLKQLRVRHLQYAPIHFRGRGGA